MVLLYQNYQGGYMGNFHIRFPDDLHWNLKKRAMDERMSLKDLVTKVLQQYLEQNPPPPTIFDQAENHN